MSKQDKGLLHKGINGNMDKQYGSAFLSSFKYTLSPWQQIEALKH